MPANPLVTMIGKELDDVARRLVVRAFEPVGTKGPLAIPELRRIGQQQFSRAWQVDQTACLELILRNAIAQLAGEFGDITQQEAAFHLFNLDGAPTFPHIAPIEPDQLDGKKYAYLVRELRTRANLHESPSSLTRRIERLRLRLADILAHSDFPSTSHDAGMYRLAESGIVTREAELTWLHTSYRELLPDGGFMQIWGVSGIGKTVLAHQFCQQIAVSSPAGFVRCGRHGLVEEDIRHVLDLEGYHPESWTDEQCRTLFRRAIQNMKAVSLLVLDGVRNQGSVTELVPNGTNIPILITTPERLSFSEPPTKQYRNIRSHQMVTFTFDQAAELLTTRFPDLHPKLVKNLSAAVGGHPESLVHIASYLTLGDAVTPAELLAELSHQPTGTLANIAEVMDVPRSAARVIQELFQRLHPAALSYTILVCLAWSSDYGQQRRELVLELVALLSGHTPSALAVRAALTELTRLGLVSITDTSIRESRLTALVVRELTPDMCQPVLLALEQTLQHKPDRHGSTLLDELRREYDSLTPLRPILAAHLDNPNEPLPALFTPDGASWALYATNDQGARRVALYRVLPDCIQVLHPGHTTWEAVTGYQLKALADMTNRARELAVSDRMRRATPEQRRDLERIIRKINDEKGG
ncbi:hypothetical protein [Candidatus Protofrankia californiensis]|uniref:hypothetical protein n=1 Tax=Candidatus Protofrankia californiensis TaxID=1839754 RepID=UPI0013ED2B53|nr:hypothetical protein [Candidatus Protofrankia californiensis]